MATNAKADAECKKGWFWLEDLSLSLLRSRSDRAKVDDYLNRRWVDLPQDCKRSLGPALYKAYNTFEATKAAQAAKNSTGALPLEGWQQMTPEDLELYVDNFATADERLSVLTKLRNAARESTSVLQELIKARNSYARQDLISIESTKAMPAFVTEAQNFLATAEKQLKEHEALMPQYRQYEADWRKLKRVRGDPIGAGWVGTWCLGAGAYGTANLWVRQNSNSVIVDRLVTKDALIEEKMLQEDDAWALHEGVYVPTEVRAPQILSGRPGSETILHVRGWREFPSQDMYRLLLEFCPYGDLQDLRYVTYEGSCYTNMFSPMMPQPFLWYVFECLATAGLLMERGSLGPQAEIAWQQIFHSDIKHANIMLGAPNRTKYCQYPTPVLADWGFAQFCPPGEQRRPRGGTPQEEAPENSGCCYAKNGKWIGASTLNRRSDVWSVGNIIRGLMAADMGDRHADFRTDRKPRDPPVDHLKIEYSDNLVNLVARCTTYFAEDRIGFEELLRTIRQFTGGHPDRRFDHVRGLRGAAANDPAWRNANNALKTPADKWPMYHKLVKIPDEKDDIALAPHRTRKLSKDMEYKGPVSADTRSLRRAGSIRKAAATMSKPEYERWLYQRRKLEDMKQKQKQGFYVPDSSDDSAGDSSDEGDSAMKEFLERQKEMQDVVESGAKASGASRIPDSHGNVGNATQPVGEEMEIETPIVPERPQKRVRKSRSVAAGAETKRQKQQQHQPPRRANPKPAVAVQDFAAAPLRASERERGGAALLAGQAGGLEYITDSEEEEEEGQEEEEEGYTESQPPTQSPQRAKKQAQTRTKRDRRSRSSAAPGAGTGTGTSAKGAKGKRSLKPKASPKAPRKRDDRSASPPRQTWTPPRVRRRSELEREKVPDFFARKRKEREELKKEMERRRKEGR